MRARIAAPPPAHAPISTVRHPDSSRFWRRRDRHADNAVDPHVGYGPCRPRQVQCALRPRRKVLSGRSAGPSRRRKLRRCLCRSSRARAASSGLDRQPLCPCRGNAGVRRASCRLLPPTQLLRRKRVLLGELAVALRCWRRRRLARPRDHRFECNTRRGRRPVVGGLVGAPRGRGLARHRSLVTRPRRLRRLVVVASTRRREREPMPR